MRRGWPFSALPLQLICQSETAPKRSVYSQPRTSFILKDHVRISKRHLFIHVHGSISRSNREIEATQASMDEWPNKTQCVHTTEYYSACVINKGSIFLKNYKKSARKSHAIPQDNEKSHGRILLRRGKETAGKRREKCQSRLSEPKTVT